MVSDGGGGGCNHSGGGDYGCEGKDSNVHISGKHYFVIHPSFFLGTHSAGCKRYPAQVAMDSTTSSSSPVKAIVTFYLDAQNSFLIMFLSHSK